MTLKHQPSSTAGILHHIPPVTAFEPNAAKATAPNLLIWIGGLFDTYHSVYYPYTLSQRLPSDWSIAQVALSSAGQGWGTSSLGKDVAELSKIVKYFRQHKKGKIVIMGHSTGCQDCMHYMSSEDKHGDRAKVDGVILQAPVSDREAMVDQVPQEALHEANQMAQQWINEGKEEDYLPADFGKHMFGKRCPITARRWISLASPDHNGEDDLFSSDLPDSRLQATFGKINVPLLIVYGEKDEYVPEKIDKKALVHKWIKVVEENDGLVDGRSAELLGGASHNLNGDPDEVVEELMKRVIGFLTGQ